MKKKITLLLFVISALLVACASPVASIGYETGADTRDNYGGGAYYEGEVDGVSFASAPEEAMSEDKAFQEPVANQSSGDGSVIERLVIKNANMTVAVGEPLATMEDIMEMADQMGGFVVNSNLYYYNLANGVEVPQANVSIRVPAERFTEAITRIEAGAGKVISKNISGQDVTQQYTDLNSRLTNLENTRDQLEIIMENATRTDDVLTVFNQLTYINEEIEVIKGQMQYFEQSAAMSYIDVTIKSDEAVQPITIGGWEPAGVAKDAIQALIDTLKGIADFFIWVVLWLLPVLLVLYLPFRLIASLFRKWNTRRKEKAAARKAEKEEQQPTE